MHSLMYHDVFPDSASHRSSGFPEDGAAVYKLPVSAFRAHLDQLAKTLPSPPRILSHRECRLAPGDRRAWSITFDDGGASAYEHIAPALEELGWRGQFFVTTARIGDAGFLTAGQIRDLHDRGHLVGSHSHNHPRRISELPIDEIRREWVESIGSLGEIIGLPVAVASVPGGFYSRSVGLAAATAGIRLLFTSQPVHAPSRLDDLDCVLLGRYAIKRGTRPREAASLAAGALRPRLLMQMGWKARGAAKTLFGSRYESLRRSLLAE